MPNASAYLMADAQVDTVKAEPVWYAMATLVMPRRERVCQMGECASVRVSTIT